VVEEGKRSCVARRLRTGACLPRRLPRQPLLCPDRARPRRRLPGHQRVEPMDARRYSGDVTAYPEPQRTELKTLLATSSRTKPAPGVSDNSLNVLTMGSITTCWALPRLVPNLQGHSRGWQSYAPLLKPTVPQRI
jgi:hypothetical protein